MRKYLIAAVAALAAIAFASVALAQEEAATMSVKLKPKEAGTKKHPANSKLKLTITNNDVHKTLTQLDIKLPKTVKLSGKGLKACKESTLKNQGATACPKASRVGGGTAEAALGVDQAQPAPLHFDVTAVVVGKKGLDFNLQATALGINVTAPGRIKSRGHKLVVKIPEEAQQPTQGVYAGLVSLTTRIGKKSGKHMLIASTGCKHGEQPFSATLHFGANPARPASTATTEASSPCTK